MTHLTWINNTPNLIMSELNGGCFKFVWFEKSLQETNIKSWKVSNFYRRNIFKCSSFSIVTLVFGGVPDIWAIYNDQTAGWSPQMMV